MGIDWIIASKTNIIVEEALLKSKAGVDHEIGKIEKAIFDDVGGKSEIVEEIGSERTTKTVKEEKVCWHFIVIVNLTNKN